MLILILELKLINMRDRIIVGNWKMNKDFEETEKMLTQLKSYSEPSSVKIMIAPSFTQLYQSVQSLKSTNFLSKTKTTS